MHLVIESLRSEGKWYIIPEGEWNDSLVAVAHSQCVCGHEISHSYFAVLVIDGEIVKTVECGSSCIMDLTHGYYYRTPYAGEWHVLSDTEMVRLFWYGHCWKNYQGTDYVDEKGGKFPPRFAISVYEFALSQMSKVGLTRVTEKQYAILKEKILA